MEKTKLRSILTVHYLPGTGQAQHRYIQRCRWQTTSKAENGCAPLSIMLLVFHEELLGDSGHTRYDNVLNGHFVPPSVYQV